MKKYKGVLRYPSPPRLLHHLDQYINRKAVCTVLLAYLQHDQIYVFQGQVHGTIVKPRESGGFGFDSYFMPDGSSVTWAESKPDQLYPRALAVEALIHGKPFVVRPAIYEWDGPWQEKD